MAKIEDVVVSARMWHWQSLPPGKMLGSVGPDSNGFRITALDRPGPGEVCYRYENGCIASAAADVIAAHAEPDPRPACRPGCAPANPCGRVDCCPTWHELNVGIAMAEARRKAEHHTPEPEPIELRCARELTCGLFRTT